MTGEYEEKAAVAHRRTRRHRLFEEIGQAVVASILVVLGLFLTLLVFSPLYPYYLNPSFRILSSIAAALLIFSGVMGAVHGFERVPVSTVLIYLLTAAMVTNSVTGTMTILASSGRFGPARKPAEEAKNLSEPLTRTGTAAERAAGEETEGGGNVTTGRDSPPPFANSYLPISIPELYLLSGDNPPEFISGKLTMRGRLLHMEENEGGYTGYLLTRPTMVCCAADALQVFIPLSFSQRIEEPPEGGLRWIAVAGRLVEKTVDIDESALRQKVPDTITAFDAVEKEHVFIVEQLAPSPQPLRPYVTLLRDEPPFDY